MIQAAKVVAAKRGTSVSALVTRQLEELVEADASYEETWQCARRVIDAVDASRGRSWRREDLHDR